MHLTTTALPLALLHLLTLTSCAPVPNTNLPGSYPDNVEDLATRDAGIKREAAPQISFPLTQVTNGQSNYVDLGNPGKREAAPQISFPLTQVTNGETKFVEPGVSGG